MPDATGYDLVAHVRSSEPAGARMPALAVTAYARDEDRRSALAAGFDVHLAKPVSPEALIIAVQRLLAGGVDPS
jgi:CheY-like chemotaxis protein